MRDGDFETAVRLYRDLVGALPANPDLHMNLGLALHSSGHYTQAIAEFRTVLQARPDSAPAWLLTGIDRQKLGQPGEAIDPLEHVLRIEPENKVALLELGDAYLNSGRPAEAASRFRRLTELDPTSARAWQGLGLSDHELAHQAFLKLEQTAPESSYWYVLAARSRLEQGQYNAAFQLYKDALAAKPGGVPGIHAGLAAVYRATGHPGWAATEDSRESALPFTPAAPDTPAAAALFYQVRQAQQSAMQAFQHLRLLPPNAELHELTAEADRMQGHYLQAEEEYRAAIRLDPANRRLQMGLAKTLWLAHAFDAARPLIADLLKTDSTSVELNYEMGDLLLDQHEPARAVEFLKTALKRDPSNRGANATLGRALMELGRPGDAIPYLKLALAADADGSTHYQLAQAYEKNGQSALAKQAFAEFRLRFQTRQKKREQSGEAQITAP